MVEQTLVRQTLDPVQPLSDRQIAEEATLHSFLNCYLRETGRGDRLGAGQRAIAPVLEKTGAAEGLRVELTHQSIEILIALRYWSPTGRHRFACPIYYRALGSDRLLELDYLTLAALVTKELSLEQGQSGGQEELLLRIIQSCQNIQHFVRDRRPHASDLYRFRQTFRETEQALVLGHHLHPTPKSRQGFSDEERDRYSPETQGAFSLHYFRAHRSLVEEGSALEQSATDLIKADLRVDPEVDPNFQALYCQKDEYSLIPVHPWQAQQLLHQPEVEALLQSGQLQDLGPQGRAFYPTSSVRTVYHPDAPFMVKLSLNIKITNSIRTNLYKELARGVEVSQILDSPIGQDLHYHFPNFGVIRDPAYITVRLPGETESSAFAAVLRANPFWEAPDTDATCLISLCQDAIDGSGSRLAAIIRTLAAQENRSTQEVSLDWFRGYLQIALKPILWLYFTYGIAVEAHQQNSVLQLQDGYPTQFLYRDNQGYYYRRSFHHLLNSILPGISAHSQTVCEDAVSDERLTYYFFLNNLLGLVNAFGVAGLIDEELLLAEVRRALAEVAPWDKGDSVLLRNLSQPRLRCKANLLTRFHDMDELVGPMATQSVYVEIDNPLMLAQTR